MNSTTSPWAISFLFRGLIHFVADVHCPPHAGIYIPDAWEIFKEGRDLRLDLHLYWDTALDLYDPRPPVDVEAKANDLIKKYPREALLPQLAKKEVLDWATYAYEVAKNHMIPGGEPWVNVQTIQSNSKYVAVGREKCQELMALAAYRMEPLLVDFVKQKKGLPLSTSPSSESTDANANITEISEVGGMEAREILALCMNRGLIGTLIVYLLLVLTKHRSLNEGTESEGENVSWSMESSSS
jgi:hypothetical protein